MNGIMVLMGKNYIDNRTFVYQSRELRSLLLSPRLINGQSD